MNLTEDQWYVISPILPKDPVRSDGRGRPWSDRRQVLDGILWILRTGAPWKDLPSRYGKYQTVHRRFQNWVRSGVMEGVLLAIAQDLKDRGGLDLRECFVDGTFVPAKKGGTAFSIDTCSLSIFRLAFPTMLRAVTVPSEYHVRA